MVATAKIIKKFDESKYGTKLICTFQELETKEQQIHEKDFMGKGHSKEALDFFDTLKANLKTGYRITHHVFQPIVKAG